mmetsp:Transcript_16433/g.31136  ORF Transcript_16433/g.31136 Transcript_16433/m.31136 type:complete len:269 (-) Transcript_16433:79-885(-)
MSGLGRRSHYRKHLTDSVLNDFPEPNPPYERIAKVIGTRGSNQFELVVDPRDDILDETPQLAILPTKFRKLVWLKRNDYVICAVAQEDEAAGDAGSSTTHRGKNHEGGIRYMIEHILYKDQVKHLKEKGLWPKHEFFWDEKNNISRDNDDDDDDDTKNDSEVNSSISSNNSDTTSSSLLSSSSFPIDLPSPILLASSMVLAIASTGSIFELSGGSPVLGFVPTLVIAIMGIPLCLFLFYAAIQKGIAETEADDIAYSNQRRRGSGNKW